MSDSIRAALERLLSDIQDLSDSSQGIVGLHRNGDPAPWNELLEGGRYSSWLGDAITAARAALAAPLEGEPSDQELTLTYARAVAAAVDGKRGPFNKEDAERAQLAGLRAVLARWGSPNQEQIGSLLGAAAAHALPLPQEEVE